MRPNISLIASAARPQYWNRLFNSLKANRCLYEVVFVGPIIPECSWSLPDNFIYRYSKCKPAQCYQAAASLASGELIGWTADDATYDVVPQSLDMIWNAYKAGDNFKTVFAQSTIEDGNDITRNHYFFHGDSSTPFMAPLGFMNREFFNQLGGYDRNFICGQSENDIVMRVLAEGGRVELVSDSKCHLHHGECHGEYTFRHGYNSDRQYLERCWVYEGYGMAEGNRSKTISQKRLLPVEPFDLENILTVNQGPAGRWA